jgi:uncharacterized SAM-binding protein YcdF (DUF218 family)
LRLRRKRIIAGVATAVVAVGLLVWFSEPLLVAMGRWLVVESPVEQADLIVALGGDRERQEEAVRLFKQGLARWVLFVGSDVRLRYYRCLGVPEDRIVPVARAYTTYEEALRTRDVVKERGFRSVLIVTSPYHLRRALWTFRQVFRREPVAVGAVAAPDNAFSINAWWRSHVGRKAVLTEYVGLVYYWLTVR